MTGAHYAFLGGVVLAGFGTYAVIYNEKCALEGPTTYNTPAGVTYKYEAIHKKGKCWVGGKYGIEDADGNLDGQDLGLHEVYVNLGKEATTVKEGRGRLSKNARIAGGVAAAVGVALLVPSLFYLIDNKEEPSEVDVMVTPQEVRMMVSLPLPIGWGR